MKSILRETALILSCCMYNVLMSNEHKGSVHSPPLVLTTMAASCNSGACPTVYSSDRNTLVVQGYEITPGQVGLSVGAGEGLVEIPIDLLREAARFIK